MISTGAKHYFNGEKMKMFGNLGLHVIKNQKETYSFVGSIPYKLGKVIPATMSDIMGGRSWRDEKTGDSVTIKFPVFESRSEAEDFAVTQGFAVEDDSSHD